MKELPEEVEIARAKQGLQKLGRMVLVGLALALLGTSLAVESHSVQSLDGGGETQVSGRAFTEGATFEQFARRDATLVGPMGAVTAQQKDCKT